LRHRTRTVALLLFGSGFSALVYQAVWLREFRLVFGASTPASAAVLAIFMAGLGFGGLALGRRADRALNALRFYGRLEIGIAVCAALSPGLFLLVRRLYVLTGGSPSLGIEAATVARLLLSAMVIGVPTFLMGGTLPAAARAAATDEDRNRTGVALLYGANTLGGVAGVLLATFLMLEAIGIRESLWAACALNGAIGLLALRIARSAPAAADRSACEEDSRIIVDSNRRPATLLVLPAAGFVGFVFLVMEIVWYRMLGPLLGGSTYTFGLILALVLLGIGAGGALYAVVGRRRLASLETFALTGALEAAWIALPLALGDRVALLALRLQPFGSEDFFPRILVWSAVASLVVLPAALVSGYQFPLLVALLGEGRKKVGREGGLAYGWNTIGAIAGSLAAGFFLIETLTAPGT